MDFGPPLHSLVLPGTLHPLEEEYIKFFSVENQAGHVSFIKAENTEGSSEGE